MREYKGPTSSVERGGKVGRIQDVVRIGTIGRIVKIPSDAAAKKYMMTVFPEKKYAFTISRQETYKAIEAARECNSKLVN